MKEKVDKDKLIKVLLGEADAEELRQVETWLAESEKNKKEYADFKFIWESSKVLSFTSSVDEHDAWSRFQQKLELKKGHEGNSIDPKKQIPFWLKMAATVLLVGIGLWISYVSILTPMLDRSLVRIQSVGETRTVTLSDGSMITLNKHSRLSYPKRFAKISRTVSLEEGEAFFDVAPDEEKPFIVEVKDVKVQVLGTSFNIKTSEKHTELIVETGIVEVSKKDVHIRLHRNERVEIDSSRDTFEKRNNSDQLYQYYRNKVFVADDTPLWRLVEVLNEAYEADIVIGSKELENQRMNTTFKNESLETIVTIICQTLNIKADKKGRQIIFHQ